MVLWAGRVAGPLVRPGPYAARVTAAEHVITVPVVVRKDPRSNVSDDDLDAQYQLARAINQRLQEANEAVLRIRHMRAQLTDQAAGPADPLTVEAGAALSATLTSLDGELYQYRNRSSQDPLNYPIRINNKLAALQGVVEAGDGAPTVRSRLVFEELSDRLTTLLARLDAIIASDVDAFNARRRRAKAVLLDTSVPTVTQVQAWGEGAGAPASDDQAGPRPSPVSVP